MGDIVACRSGAEQRKAAAVYSGSEADSGESGIQVVAQYKAVAQFPIGIVDGAIAQRLAHGKVQCVVAAVGQAQPQAGRAQRIALTPLVC
jgi:hypothetical protein